MKYTLTWIVPALFLCAICNAGDILIGYFEQKNFGDLQVSGDVFGSGPTKGVLTGQPYVAGFWGKGFANPHHNGT